jgi:hypothetical protein
MFRVHAAVVSVLSCRSRPSRASFMATQHRRGSNNPRAGPFRTPPPVSCGANCSRTLMFVLTWGVHRPMRLSSCRPISPVLRCVA